MRKVMVAVAIFGAWVGCGGDDVGEDAGASDAATHDAVGSDAAVSDATASDTGSEDDGGATDAAAGEDAASERPCEGPIGLYADAACRRLAPDVMPYEPQFWLWSDGTDKERYVSLPAGATIDAGDPDGWVFPVGTRVWKTFLLGGRRLETRYFEKIRDDEGIGAWDVRTYQWNEAQDRAVEVTEGATDVLGTSHDIPAVSLCAQCHEGGGQRDVLLGFSALQLNHRDTTLSLADLNASGRLDPPVPAAADIPSPDPTVRAALGYLHANCGHCHGGAVPRVGLDLFVRSGLSSVEETGVYRSAVGQLSVRSPLYRIAPGDPDASLVSRRMGVRGLGRQMPPLATDEVDAAGLSAVRAWIAGLPAGF